MFGVSRLNSRSLRIGDPPADTYLPSAHGPSSVRTPCLGRHCWSCCGGAAGQAGAGGQRPWVSPAWLGTQRRSEQSPGEEGISGKCVRVYFPSGRGRGLRTDPGFARPSPCVGRKHLLRNSAKLPTPSRCTPSPAVPPRPPPSPGRRRSLRAHSRFPAVPRAPRALPPQLAGVAARRPRRRPCRSCLVIRTRVPGGFRPLAGGPRQWAGVCWWAWGAGCRAGPGAVRAGAPSPGRPEPGGASAGTRAPPAPWVGVGGAPRS